MENSCAEKGEWVMTKRVAPNKGLVWWFMTIRSCLSLAFSGGGLVAFLPGQLATYIITPNAHFIPEDYTHYPTHSIMDFVALVLCYGTRIVLGTRAKS